MNVCSYVDINSNLEGIREGVGGVSFVEHQQ